MKAYWTQSSGTWDYLNAQDTGVSWIRNNWQHVCLTRNSGVIELYWNGVLGYSVTNQLTNPINYSNGFF